jgi:hypothetical protein
MTTENIFSNVTPETKLYIRTSAGMYSIVTVKSISKGGRVTTVSSSGYEQKWNSEGYEVGDKDRFNSNRLLSHTEETAQEIRLAKERQAKAKKVNFLNNFDYSKLDETVLDQIKALLENSEK